MSADPGLDQLTREELITRAKELGARRPEVMTRVELRDEIVRLSEPDPQARRRSRGWLGVARDLVASVMDAGLNMPGAAAAVRGDARPAAEETTGPPPVATLTLAEIYLAQGHVERALAVLEEVLTAEPDLAPALALRERIQRGELPSRRRPAPEPEDSPVSAPAPAPFFTPPPPAAVFSRPEPEPAVEAAPEPAPEPAVEAAPDPEPEPAVEAAPEPEPAPAVEAAPAPEPAVEAAPEPEPAVEAAPALADSTPFVASVPSPDAVRVPAVALVAEPAPPTLAAPPAASSPATPTAPPVDVKALAAEPPVAPACALARGTGTVEGHYALPADTHGALLRVVWFVPGIEGPTQGGVDLPLGEARGRVTLPALDGTAEVRAALGVGEGSAFRPLAVAWVYRVDEGRVSVEFAPPGAEPSTLRAQLGRAAADLGV